MADPKLPSGRGPRLNPGDGLISDDEGLASRRQQVPVYSDWLIGTVPSLAALDDKLNLIELRNVLAAEVASEFDGTGLGLTTGKYADKAICNGSNGTPNLDEQFPRMQTSGASGTGGSDSSAHTHAIDHDHGSFTGGAEAAHTHSTPSHAHSGTGLYANVSLTSTGTGKILVDMDAAAPDWTSTHSATATGYARTTEGVSENQGSRVTGSTATDGSGTTGAGSSHSHTVDVPNFTGTSGAASVTENRPAYYELLPLMQLPLRPSAANTMYLYYVGEVTSGIWLKEARLVVTEAVASSTVKVALFMYNKLPKRGFFKLPGSEVTFTASTIGLKQITLPREIQLEPGAKLFIAIAASSASIGLSGVRRGPVSKLLPVFSLGASGLTFGSQVELSFATKNYNEKIFAVQYLSAEAAQVM